MNFEGAFKLLAEKLSSWGKAAILLLPNIIIAAGILVIAFFISRYVQKITKKLLNRYLNNHALVNFLSILSNLGVLFIGLIIGINVLKLNDAVVSLLAGIGIAGIALGFALQDVASNFISGIALVLRKDDPFQVGDIVETNDYLGVIQEIDLRSTKMQTFTGQYVFIPNKLIFEHEVINYSLPGIRRVDISVGISYGDDLEKVKSVTVKALEDMPNRIKNREIQFFYEEFGNSSINFQVFIWINFREQKDFLQTRSEAVMRIKKAYDENNITIPFPIRTLDFGIKGGKTLAEMMPK